MYHELLDEMLNKVLEPEEQSFTTKRKYNEDMNVDDKENEKQMEKVIKKRWMKLMKKMILLM